MAPPAPLAGVVVAASAVVIHLLQKRIVALHDPHFCRNQTHIRGRSLNQQCCSMQGVEAAHRDEWAFTMRAARPCAVRETSASARRRGGGTEGVRRCDSEFSSMIKSLLRGDIGEPTTSTITSEWCVGQCTASNDGSISNTTSISRARERYDTRSRE